MWKLIQPANRRVLFQRQVCANALVVGDVPFRGPSKVLLAENDCVVQTFSSDRADDALRVRVLPGRCRRRQNFGYTNAGNFAAEMRTEFSVPITNEVFRRIGQANSLDDLPCCSFCAR